jgi:hypothetical protein
MASQNELGADPVLMRVLQRRFDDEPGVAVGNGLFVIDLGKVPNDCLACHILILCAMDCQSHIIWSF